jgi:YHS domain-containing protein
MMGTPALFSDLAPPFGGGPAEDTTPGLVNLDRREIMPETNRLHHLGRLALALVCLLALVFGVAQAGEKKAETSTESAKPALQRVETKKVCMVNNQVFEKDQIPASVQGKTYYGCCEMCKERLAKDAAARTGIDPVTGKPVDKATAVIAALPDGKVLYFESEKTFEQYTEGEKK